MNLDDRQQLKDFIGLVSDDLSTIFVVACRDYMSEELHRLLVEAWSVTRQRGELDRLAEQVESGRHDEDLDSAGLSGPELAFKLAGWRGAREAGLENATLRSLKRWLKWIDVPLGSLLAVIGVGESVKEIKEGVEAELEGLPEEG